DDAAWAGSTRGGAFWGHQWPPGRDVGVPRSVGDDARPTPRTRDSSDVCSTTVADFWDNVNPVPQNAGRFIGSLDGRCPPAAAGRRARAPHDGPGGGTRAQIG